MTKAPNGELLPPDQALVTQLRALGVIYAGWARLADDGFSVDGAAGLGGGTEPHQLAEVVQMSMRLRQAVEDGHAVLVGEPDEDGYRELRITDAGIAVLDREAAQRYGDHGRPTP